MCMHRYTFVYVYIYIYVYMLACICLNIYICINICRHSLTSQTPNNTWNTQQNKIFLNAKPQQNTIYCEISHQSKNHIQLTRNKTTSKHSQLTTSQMKKPNLSNTARRTTIKCKTRDTLKHKSQQQATSQLEIKLEKTLFGTSEEPKFKKTKTHRMG